MYYALYLYINAYHCTYIWKYVFGNYIYDIYWYVYMYRHINTIYIKQGRHFALVLFMGAAIIRIRVLSNWICFVVNSSLTCEWTNTLPQSREGWRSFESHWGKIMLKVLCNTTFTHVIPFNPHINSARGRNFVDTTIVKQDSWQVTQPLSLPLNQDKERLRDTRFDRIYLMWKVSEGHSGPQVHRDGNSLRQRV